MFVSPHKIGSVHDYQLHKEYHVEYLPFLLKTPKKQVALDTDQDSRYWVIIANIGYIGPATNTPDVCRITLHKRPLLFDQLTTNQVISRIRIPVEQFFGHLTQKFAVLHNKYI